MMEMCASKILWRLNLLSFICLLLIIVLEGNIMSVRVLTASYIGIMPYLVEVETDILLGIPNLSIVGMGDTAIYEVSIELGLQWKIAALYHLRSITISYLRLELKEGANFDFTYNYWHTNCYRAIRNKTKSFKKDYLFLGELSLDGKLRAIRGLINSL